MEIRINALCLIFFMALLKVKSVPLNPCPQIFENKYDGFKWFGVVRIYPQIYNRFQTDHLTMVLILGTDLHIPYPIDGSLQLYKSLRETYKDIAVRRPILYRIKFPNNIYRVIGSDAPELLEIRLNGVLVCRSYRKYEIKYFMNLRQTFYLPALDSEEEQLDDFEFNFNPDSPKPAIPSSMLNIPKVIAQRVDKDAENISGLKPQNPRWNQRLLATNSQCGKYDDDLKYTQLISGGQKIIPGTWPWLVGIFRKDSIASNLVFQCTGSLISNRLVLTAAHCFKSNFKHDQIAAKNIVLAFGRHDIRDWTEKDMLISDVDEIDLHPDYLNKKESTIFDADIAILITKDFIAYTSMIKPICLWPTSVDKDYSIIGTNGTLVGWGQPIQNIDENVPRRLTLPVVRNNFCFPSDKLHIAQRIFCAGTEKPGYAPCNGDSGSAFAIHANGAWFLRGLVSAALGDPILNRCDLNTFAIFTDIVNFRTWIDSYM